MKKLNVDVLEFEILEKGLHIVYDVNEDRKEINWTILETIDHLFKSSEIENYEIGDTMADTVVGYDGYYTDPLGPEDRPQWVAREVMPLDRFITTAVGYAGLERIISRMESLKDAPKYMTGFKAAIKSICEDYAHSLTQKSA